MKVIFILVAILLIPRDSISQIKADVTYQHITHTIDIRAKNEVIIHHTYTAQVWNATGAELSALQVYVNKNVEIESIEGAMYDMEGNKLKEVKTKDIKDLPLYDGFSLFSDSRFKSHRFYSGSYPYTVSYSYQQRLAFNMFNMDFVPQPHASSAVEHFKGILLFDEELEPNYRLMGSKGKVSRSQVGKKQKLEYTVTGLLPLKKEPFSPPSIEGREGLEVFCKKCYYGGVEVNADSWKGYGELMVRLNKDKDRLPLELVERLKAMTEGMDEVQKIKTLYKFLQENTRYVSVQIGVGGIQPIGAAEVYSNGYGDCKGLSNYLKSMLACVGVKSHYVVVEAGPGPTVIEDGFVCDPFNHVILCAIPNQSDTVWLECTSRFDPPGYQGAFTSNRKALLIEREGSKLISTQKYSEDDNTSLAKLEVKPGEGGDLWAQITMENRCEKQDYWRSLYYSGDKAVTDDYWQQAFIMPSYSVHRYHFDVSETEALAKVSLELVAGKAMSNSGNRIFMQALFTHGVQQKLVKDTSRLNPLYLEKAFTEIDTFVFQIPEGYRLESGAKNMSLKSEFGSYTMDVNIQQNVLTMVRKRIQRAGTFDKNRYNEFVKFNNEMYQNDRNKIVWVKNVNKP